MDLQLTGARALVTGASRGIGRAIAETLAEEGCALAICARGQEGLDAAASALRERGATVHAEAFDVADTAQLAGFVDRSAQQLGGLDAVVSNVSAGASKAADQWQRSLDGDLLPLVRLIEAAVPHLEQGGGSIVSIGTTNAFDTVRPASPNAYSALKAAVLHHAAAQSRALAPRGIRVNTVSPGPIEFPGGDWEKIRAGRREVYDEVLAKIPVGRYGRPEDVAAAVAFLLSPRSAFTTGVNLVVDGGIVTRVQS
ncbi:SDR family oxidoreductase [Modestobacter sp. I12A-02628]|uniref:SDR family oxidoreductase n=1 Tax=Goekera deserti TaxID=2497753 RepID=A0A7K3WHS6_9ACTN|nr:SDR family NAD(P)-dependent oxidoreductase [Goekera deserti]MPQ96534.1 SDR family oxidoreductase [Goekera deserti]NDI47151.1 SDR family oxidoreductase [Goekera deserti]NEL55449.1 SDR family oxidoreductase [Goekera deserti]